MRTTGVSLSVRRAPPADDSNYAGSACPAGSAGLADLPAPPAPPASSDPPTPSDRPTLSDSPAQSACPASVRLASRHMPADDCNFVVPENLYQSKYFNYDSNRKPGHTTGESGRNGARRSNEAARGWIEQNAVRFS